MNSVVNLIAEQSVTSVGQKLAKTVSGKADRLKL